MTFRSMGVDIVVARALRTTVDPWIARLSLGTAAVVAAELTVALDAVLRVR
jgi:hypothetical protein